MTHEYFGLHKILIWHGWTPKLKEIPRIQREQTMNHYHPKTKIWLSDKRISLFFREVINITTHKQT